MEKPISISRIRFTEEKLLARIKAIGQEISQQYAGQELILISVLKGSLYFFADLTRAITIPVQLDFISIGTYPTTTNQQGIVRITKDLDLEITGKHVLLIEDIIRTGLTTGYLVQTLQTRLPASLNVCTLLQNPDEQLIKVPIAFCGFIISANRLIGYGMDVHEQGRNLPYIAEIDKSL